MTAIAFPAIARKSAAPAARRKSESLDSSIETARRILDIAKAKIDAAKANIQTMTARVSEIEAGISDAETRLNELQPGDYPAAADGIANELRDLEEAAAQIAYA